MASINEKLNYINETKSLIKDKLNDLGSEITNQTTFRDYADKIENLYEEWPKTSDEDIIISLENTKKGKMNLQLKGNVNQFTTTGKNKFNGNAVTTTTPTNWDIIFENNILTIQHKNTYSTGTPGINLGILDNGTYTLNGTLSDRISLYKDDVYSTVLANGDTFNTNGTENISIKFGNSEATTKTYSNLMISIGGGDYEPYTGGIASPNPDYPQDIEVVTGENEIKIQNKNLAWNGWAEDFVNRINNSNMASLTTKDGKNCLKIDRRAGYNNYDNQYLFKTKWKENTQYAISCNLFAEGDNALVNIAFQYTDGTLSDHRYDRTINGWKSFSLISDEAKTIKYIQVTWLAGYNYIDLDTFMIEPGSTVTNYEEPKVQNYSINLGNLELCKINNSQDYIYKNNNKWYKKPYILKIANYNSESISTSYKSTTGSLTTGATVYYINPNNNPDGIEITNTTLITQLNTLEQVISYNGQTNISQENDNLPFIISASALLKNSN